jgi:hypothetical protein
MYVFPNSQSLLRCKFTFMCLGELQSSSYLQRGRNGSLPLLNIPGTPIKHAKQCDRDPRVTPSSHSAVATVYGRAAYNQKSTMMAGHKGHKPQKARARKASGCWPGLGSKCSRQRGAQTQVQRGNTRSIWVHSERIPRGG